MAANPTGNSSLVDRVKNILLTPKTEWPRIDAEPATTTGIFTSYVMILAAIGPVAGLIGQQFVGYSGYGIAKPSLGLSLGTAVLSYLLTLAGVWVLAKIIDFLAPTFGGTRDDVKALKVAAYAWTAAFLAGIVQIIPALAILGLVGLYSVYLLYLGLPVLMKTSTEKAVGYTVATCVGAILLWLLIGIVTHELVGAIATTQPAPGTVTYTVPG